MLRAFHFAGAAPFIVATAVLCGAANRQGAPAPSAGQPAPEIALSAVATELTIREGLVVGLLGSYGRSAVPTDLLAWQIATGAFREPRQGDILGPDDHGSSQTWTRLEAGTDGWFQNRALNNGYLFFVVSSARARTMILDASGYYVARINGEPRGGEKYGTDWVRHPVRLRAGRNTFLVQGERGRFRARLIDPPAPIFFTASDATLPDLVVGRPGSAWAGIRLVNATEEAIDSVRAAWTLGGQTQTVEVPAFIPPLTTGKLPIPLTLTSPAAEGPLTLAIKATARSGRRVYDIPPFEIALKAEAATAHYVRTFTTEIDGSVQYYAVVPADDAGQTASAQRPALILSLHGAGVEAIGQARAYKLKDWCYIVAPTNRRPYGFDWEDWGRLDALEVLGEAARAFNTDPARTYLTGHSMGGHGTWQIGATLPDLWAAIAPSAGWYSFSSYGGGVVYKDPTPVERMLARANHPGETPELQRNFLQYGIYVLHGEKDDNVPVTQARFMRELLAKFHADFAYYERPGAGHWWGDECVDWPPLFDFLMSHVRLPDADVTKVEFITANPGISARSSWVTVLAQEHPLEYSRVSLARDPKTGVFAGTTENVARLSLEPAGAPAPERPVTVELDGTPLEVRPAADGRLYLERVQAGWRSGAPPDPAMKGPLRSGGFKDAFRHHVVFVYGTLGTPEENTRAFNKARFDAETWWYRANGHVPVVSDRVFDPVANADHNVVLYGNADTNACWKTLLGDGPVEIRNGRARVGGQVFTGPDLAAYVIRPRRGSATASVGVVAWTGPAGWTAAGPVQYFVSGAGFPDLLIYSADSLRAGTGGIRAIGWFGNDWSVERGEFVFAPGSPVTPR